MICLHLCLCLCVCFTHSGNIIGSGIFVSPKGVLENASSVGVAIIVWVTTGVITAIGAVCYAELGVTIPKSGGDYSYVKDIFGGLAGWEEKLFVWLSWISVTPWKGSKYFSIYIWVFNMFFSFLKLFHYKSEGIWILAGTTVFAVTRVLNCYSNLV